MNWRRRRGRGQSRRRRRRQGGGRGRGPRASIAARVIVAVATSINYLQPAACGLLRVQCYCAARRLWRLAEINLSAVNLTIYTVIVALLVAGRLLRGRRRPETILEAEFRLGLDLVASRRPLERAANLLLHSAQGRGDIGRLAGGRNRAVVSITVLSDDIHLNEVEATPLDGRQTAPGKQQRGAEHAHGRRNHHSTDQVAHCNLRRPMMLVNRVIWSAIHDQRRQSVSDER
jgi:hypothetical protein